MKVQRSKVEECIKTETVFDVSKTISEYVWFDTYTEMDHGWIDFDPEEFQAAYQDQDQ